MAFDTATERSWIIGRDVADLLLLLRGGWQPSESLPLGSSEAMRRLRPEEMTSLLAALRERGLANGPFAAHSDGSIDVPGQNVNATSRGILRTLQRLTDVRFRLWVVPPVPPRLRGPLIFLARASPAYVLAGTIWSLYDLFSGSGARFLADVRALGPSQFRLESFIALFAISMTLKCLHEIGHALAFGAASGQPTEIGVRLFYGLPQYYANISGIVAVANRWSRVAVLASGVGVEVLVALAIRMFPVAAGTSTSLVVRSLIMIVIPMSLVLNILLPFHRNDGYFMLQELTGVYNLRIKARATARREFFSSGDVSGGAKWVAWYGMAEAMGNAFVVTLVIGVVFSSAGRWFGAVAGLASGGMAFYATLGMLGKPRSRRWRLD